MNNRFRMRFKAQWAYSDYKSLMHNRRIVWMRAYRSGALFREITVDNGMTISTGYVSFPPTGIIDASIASRIAHIMIKES